MISILSASRNCKDKVDSCQDLGPFMRCKFFEGQKDAYEFMAMMLILQIFLITWSCVIAYKRTKKVAIRFVNRNNNANLAMISSVRQGSGEPRTAVRRPPSPPINKELAVNDCLEDAWL